MSTRKIKDAVDLSTDEKVYYKSHAKATYMSDGKTVEDVINAKQDSIADLETIRSGSAKGTTALQSSDIAIVATSGSYNDLKDKPSIPTAVTESIVSEWGFTKNTGTYSKPSTGIPTSDLEQDIQNKLDKIGSNGIAIIEHGTSDTTLTIEPNTLHNWSAVKSLNISFSEEDVDIANKYMFQFICSPNNTSISLPENVVWEDSTVSNNMPELTPLCTYQVSIFNDIAHIYGGFNSYEFTKPRLANAGDIAYKSADGQIRVIPPELWYSSLGTPVGVVVVPSGFAPDNGKARIINLSWVNSNGAASTTETTCAWTNSNRIDTSVTNYNQLPLTNNTSSTVTSSNTSGYLPSEYDTYVFGGATSYVDPLTRYPQSIGSNMIPSPYLGDKPNPAYYAPISNYSNALADFNGKGNTDILVALGSSYVAANAARNYKVTGAEEIEWYLPAIGELGYLMVRFGKIMNSIKTAGGTMSTTTNVIWSSTEKNYDFPWSAAIFAKYGSSYKDGLIYSSWYKSNGGISRPFAQLDF